MCRWGLFLLHISDGASWRANVCFHLALQECLFRAPAELSRDDTVYLICITVYFGPYQGGAGPLWPACRGRWCRHVAWDMVPLNVAVRMLGVTSLQEWQRSHEEGGDAMPRYCSDIHLRCCQIVQWNLGFGKLCIFTGETYTRERDK